MSDFHVQHFIRAMELVSIEIGKERSDREWKARMPEWGPDSRTYAQSTGAIQGLQLALDILQSEYGEACAETSKAEA